jgi:integrase
MTKRRDKRVKPDGDRWQFTVDVPSLTGARRQLHRRGFATEAAANEALKKLLDDHDAGTAVNASKMTCAAYWTSRWLPALEGRNLRATTLDTYRRTVSKHLVPHLGTYRLQALDTASVETMLGELARDGLSPKSRRNVHGILSKSLADAVRWRLVASNAATGVELPRQAPPTPRAWTGEQLDRFLERSEFEPLRALWRFYAVTGCRRGEGLGLRWRDLDLDRGTATIVNQRAIAGGSVVEGAPKTAAGARTVSLDDDTVAELRAHRVEQRAEYMKLGIRPDHDLVFTGPTGAGVWPQRVTARFRELCDELGLPRIGVHGLRHTVATWMISHGMDAKLVAQHLGHAHVSVTLGLYTHVAPSHDRAAVEAFVSALGTSRTARRDQNVTKIGEDGA